jgi:hypothetical protein
MKILMRAKELMGIVDGSDLVSHQGKDEENINGKREMQHANTSGNIRETRENPHPNIHNCVRNVRHLEASFSAIHLSAEMPFAARFLKL